MGMKRRSFLKSLLSVPVVAALAKSTKDPKIAKATLTEETIEVDYRDADAVDAVAQALGREECELTSTYSLDCPTISKPDWSKVTNKWGEWHMNDCIQKVLNKHLEQDISNKMAFQSGGMPYFEFYCRDTVTGQNLFILGTSFDLMQISDENLREQLQLKWESFLYNNAEMYEDHKEAEERRKHEGRR
jgi:hypothetical protein